MTTENLKDEVYPVSLTVNDNLAKTESSLMAGWQTYTALVTFSQDGRYTVSYLL